MRSVSTKSLLEFVYDGGVVKRFHNERVLLENLNSSHSFGVAWLCYHLSDRLPRVQLIMAALAHDLGEQGPDGCDVSAPVKRAIPGLREKLAEYEDAILAHHGVLFELTEDEKIILKLADAMDGLMFCRREAALGNLTLVSVAMNFAGYIEALPMTSRQLALFKQILDYDGGV